MDDRGSAGSAHDDSAAAAPRGGERSSGLGGDPDAGRPYALAGDYAALLSSAEQVLDDVDRVLAALDAGSYGRCVDCGQPVDGATLAADPLASRCDAHRAPPDPRDPAASVRVPGGADPSGPATGAG